MFTKPANSVGRPDAEAARKPLAASLVAENVTLTGELASDGEVHLDGRLKGDARVNRLLVGEGGAVEGTIEADVVEVRGKVRGTITARSVRLHASADVEGDIAHAELSIEAGARFNGRSQRLEPPPPSLQVVSAAE
ncbi:MAG: polymer-forming cytoskeletal protein [Phenylobacterium sp.]|nr:MAG: polymer-forming cytoskeletal protein [Phenylobacterium sp.]